MSTKPISKVLSIRRYKAGYEVRTELVSVFDGADAIKMECAYTPNGDYIGDPRTAHRLVVSRGIQPQKNNPAHCVCSIGYSSKDGKWYGWSHRAIYGFKVGSTCHIGDCHFVPRTKTEHKKASILFWVDSHHLDIEGQFEPGGVKVTWKYSKEVVNEELRGTQGGAFMPYPKQWGRGEWVAYTTANMKQMAMDFAEGVS